jgi:sugar O-acyltransferase (sialic acid O-acetyltransferase NeuD family)
MKTKNLIFVGFGSFGREVFNWIKDDSFFFSKYQNFFYTDDKKAPEKINDIKYIGKIADFSSEFYSDDFILTIADPFSKKETFNRLFKLNLNFVSFIHRSVVVSPSAKFGTGVIICPNSLISSDSILGDFVFVNGLSSVGHDAIIDNFSTLSAHVDIMGFSKIGKLVFFGSGSRAFPKSIIGDNCKIGAGATVMKKIPDNTTIYITPSKIL